MGTPGGVYCAPGLCVPFFFFFTLECHFFKVSGLSSLSWLSPLFKCCVCRVLAALEPFFSGFSVGIENPIGGHFAVAAPGSTWTLGGHLA